MHTFGSETNTYLNGKPTNCHWCGGKLDRLPHVFKGQGCSRYYDSENCLIRGEERAAQRRDAELKYLAAAAGRVNLHWTATLAAILSVLMVAFIFNGGTRAWAQENGHALHHADHYSTWQRADGKGSCCNAQTEVNGELHGDCRPARAYPDPDGQWHVLIRGQYVPVPRQAIRDYPTPDGNSHVCEDENNGIMCFVRGLPKS